MEGGRDEKKVNDRERERERTKWETEDIKRKCKGGLVGWLIRAKRGGGSGRERAKRKKDKGMSKKGRREEKQVRGGGIRGGDVTFRLSGVCFECMCGAQSGLKASGTPLNLHSQSSFFIPLITWLSSDQSTASPA